MKRIKKSLPSFKSPQQHVSPAEHHFLRSTSRVRPKHTERHRPADTGPICVSKIPYSKEYQCSSGPREQPGRQVSRVLDCVYTFSNQLLHGLSTPTSPSHHQTLINYTSTSIISSTDLVGWLIWQIVTLVRVKNKEECSFLARAFPYPSSPGSCMKACASSTVMCRRKAGGEGLRLSSNNPG